MLSPAKKRESLAGKLLLSSALVVVSLAYGWWQRHDATGPRLATAPALSASNKLVRAPDRPAVTATAPAAPATPANQASVPAPESVTIARAAPQPKAHARTAAPAVDASSQSPVPPQMQAAAPAASPPALTAQQAMEMYLPTEAASPPLPPVVGAPPAGAVVPVPAGTHLEDGDYLSDKHEFEWGDLKVRISVHGGQITGVQILQYPDHRSQSLYLSQMAGPILESELIKSQQSQVDIVSSATDTTYAFQDTIANAIAKATRG
jgi:uncharacterized protein with FMN-binding domain